jgi:UDP:flavonoid glycosyltransferase YjiC (YdhE family)
VRALFTFTGGNGHFLPTLPIARSLAARGHEVLYSPQEMMVGTVKSAGFPAVGSGGRTLLDPSERLPLTAVDRVREQQVFRDHFAGATARERSSRLLGVAAQFRPDVVVRDEADVGAAVAAERLGIPHVSVVVLAAGGFVTVELLSGALDELRARHGLDPDPGMNMVHRYLTLVPVPPSFRDPADPLPATAQHIRPAVLDPPKAGEPPDTSSMRVVNWLSAATNRPTVYFTLGTVFHQESGDLFPRVVAALTQLDVRVLVTVGREIDPAELGVRAAPHVLIERYVPQERVLPMCDMVISSAGSGGVVGALAFGVPLVLLPMGADQPQNADRCSALGIGRTLDPITSTGAQIREAVAAVLADPSYRDAARRIQQETGSLPTSAHAAVLIENLVRDRPRTA